MKKLIIGSVVRQKFKILQEFLLSLQELDLSGFEVCFYFIDDNLEADSSSMLREFRHSAYPVLVQQVNSEGEYLCDEKTHYWTAAAMLKVGRYKDQLLEYALAKESDLFLIDSDLILHPWTLQQLWYSQREIISEIFWTRWQPEEPPLPQVWLKGQYTLYQQDLGERLEAETVNYRINNFLQILQQPGLYEVGGLGACTLIRHEAIAKGVNYQPIANLELIGEDRHFSVRAAALGLSLYVDTQLPAYHLYRLSDLEGLANYRAKCIQSVKISTESGYSPRQLQPQKSLTEKRRVKIGKNHLTLVMLVRNEADRYLHQMLTETSKFIDAAVILDDASTDETPAICEAILSEAGIPLVLQRNQEHGFHNEIELRRQLWELAIATDPDWLLFLDADEIFEKQTSQVISFLLEDSRWDFYSFRLYDFWDAKHYREDHYWQAHLNYRPFLLRYQPEYDYCWAEQPLHCGRMPKNVTTYPGMLSKLRVKHYGWATEAARKSKYQFYLQHDSEGTWGILEQYQSILDPNPHLIRWVE